MSVAIAMPIYNEADGFLEFFLELWNEFTESDIHFVFVNDYSTDNTEEILGEIQTTYGPRIHLVNNAQNLGHGKSTISGMNEALSLGTKVVITVDGDGQFYAHDIRSLYVHFLSKNADILEGVRASREDPIFRKLSTLCTKILVSLKCWKIPRDANTPLRIYKRKILADILIGIPNDSLIPNLHISAISRIKKLSIQEFPIKCINRRGKSKNGTTWNNKTDFLPSKRFIKFCSDAMCEWVSTNQ
jgi:dolichol-phosphate mannosyltransferase